MAFGSVIVLNVLPTERRRLAGFDDLDAFVRQPSRIARLVQEFVPNVRPDDDRINFVLAVGPSA